MGVWLSQGPLMAQQRVSEWVSAFVSHLPRKLTSLQQRKADGLVSDAVAVLAVVEHSHAECCLRHVTEPMPAHFVPGLVPLCVRMPGPPKQARPAFKSSELWAQVERKQSFHELFRFKPIYFSSKVNSWRFAVKNNLLFQNAFVWDFELKRKRCCSVWGLSNKAESVGLDKDRHGVEGVVADVPVIPEERHVVVDHELVQRLQAYLPTTRRFEAKDLTPEEVDLSRVELGGDHGQLFANLGVLQSCARLLVSIEHCPLQRLCDLQGLVDQIGSRDCARVQQHKMLWVCKLKKVKTGPYSLHECIFCPEESSDCFLSD